MRQGFFRNDFDQSSVLQEKRDGRAWGESYRFKVLPVISIQLRKKKGPKPVIFRLCDVTHSQRFDDPVNVAFSLIQHGKTQVTIRFWLWLEPN